MLLVARRSKFVIKAAARFYVRYRIDSATAQEQFFRRRVHRMIERHQDLSKESRFMQGRNWIKYPAHP
jgi:hypothetical protein